MLDVVFGLLERLGISYSAPPEARSLAGASGVLVRLLISPSSPALDKPQVRYLARLG